ncbi:MAG: hypothetical protein ACTHW2_10405 [Tissierella sp.]|uniref:hypothetical protein n=1 Tax=Tissierella sp. TaxID=41274 RepID=UPI003F974E62
MSKKLIPLILIIVLALSVGCVNENTNNPTTGDPSPPSSEDDKEDENTEDQNDKNEDKDKENDQDNNKDEENNDEDENKDDDNLESIDFSKYLNARFGYSIKHPSSWEYREADNSDGITFFLDNDDIDIRVYGLHYMEDVSDPYINEQEKDLQRSKKTLDSGVDVTILKGQTEEGYHLEMVYLDDEDIEYHFLSKTSQKFYDENKDLIEKMIYSFDPK